MRLCVILIDLFLYVFLYLLRIPVFISVIDSCLFLLIPVYFRY